MTVHSEEQKQLLRRIVESFAWRQLASINMLGHCLKYIPELDTKLTVAAELDLTTRATSNPRMSPNAACA